MTRDPEEIREDIERTRENLGGDVDAIADRVSPSNIAHRQTEKIKGSVRRAKDTVMGSVESAMGSVGSAGEDAGGKLYDAPGTVANKARGNPMAAGLIAFGAGLLLSSLVPGSEKEREMVHTLKEKAEPLTEELTSAAKDIAADMKEPAAEAVESLKASARDSAESLKTETVDEASHLQGQASDAASNLSESGGSTTGSTGPDTTPRTSGGF
jgi:gas vesicle protein